MDKDKIDPSSLSTDPGIAESKPSLCLDSMVKVDFGAVSDAGKVRKNNEDHYLIGRLGRTLEPLMTNMPDGLLPDNIAEYGYGMVVADGMGGAAAGEVASRMATNLLVKLIIDTGKWGRRIDRDEAEALMDRMEGYYKTIHEKLVQQGEINPAIAGMGTTLTAAYSFCSDLFVAHVGDSRVYLFRNGKLRQLTHDHTMAQRLADNGDIPQDAVATHRLRHMLTNVLGGHSGPIITEVQQFQIKDRDRLLLCSDGLTEMVDDSDIAKVLQKIENPQKACERLLSTALDAGGKDNITIVIAHYSFSDMPQEMSP